MIISYRSSNCGLGACTGQSIVNSRRQQGLTLLELIVVLLILITLSTVAVRATSGLKDQVRWEQTRDRYQAIKNAIIGDPDLVINGQPDINGFVADMGRLPRNIHELLEEDFCFTDRTLDVGTCAPADWRNQTNRTPPSATSLGYGWNGPYLDTITQAKEADSITDGWGREAQSVADQDYGWVLCLGDAPDFDNPSTTCFASAPSTSGTNQLAIKSYGRDGSEGGSEIYDKDYPIDKSTPLNALNKIKELDWKVSIGSGIQVSFQSDFSGSCAITFTGPTCEIAGGVWHGSCSDTSYTNRYSCVLNGETWTDAEGCSDPMYTTQTDCENNGETWGACTDNEAIESKHLCEGLNGTWTADQQAICLNIEFRDIDGMGETILKTVESGVEMLTKDGFIHVYTFEGFMESGSPIGKLPIGNILVSVREFDGDCASDNPIYPSTAQLLKFPLVPNQAISTINWN